MKEPTWITIRRAPHRGYRNGNTCESTSIALPYCSMSIKKIFDLEARYRDLLAS